MATIVKGDLYERLDGKLCEIKRQMRQKEGYPFDPARLDLALQALIEGRFDSAGEHLGFPVIYDQSVGLMELIRRALGPGNVGHFPPEIDSEHFPFKGTGVRAVDVRVKRIFSGETGEQAAKRLVASGYTLANTGDLVGFLASHPNEVEKWAWVIALSEDSRWTSPLGCSARVPYALAHGAHRSFDIVDFRCEFSSPCGVLVISRSFFPTVTHTADPVPDGWTVVEDVAPSEFDVSKMRPISFITREEFAVNSEVMRERAVKKGCNFGLVDGMRILTEQDKLSARFYEIGRILLPGTVLCDENGALCIPVISFDRDRDRWVLYFRHLHAWSDHDCFVKL